MLKLSPAPEVSKVPRTPEPRDTATVVRSDASDLPPELTPESATAWLTKEVPK